MTFDKIQSSWLAPGSWSRTARRESASESARRIRAGIESRAIPLAYTALTLVALTPLLFVTMPPLVDLPNHVARMYILATHGGDAHLQLLYEPSWRFRTYLLPDLVGVALSKVLPIYLVGKLYVAAAIAALAASTYWLSKSLVGRPSIWILTIFLFLFNQPLSWGFINYLLGTALCFTAFALWLKYDGRPSIPVSAFIGVLSLATYLTHIIALALLGLFLGAHQLRFALDKTDEFRWRAFLGRCLHIGLYFTLPVILFLTADAGESVRTGPTVFGDLAARLRALFSPTLLNGGALDLYAWFFVVGTFFLLACTRSLKITRQAILPILLLAVVSVAMPKRLEGVFGLDFRFPVVLCLFVAASIKDHGVSTLTRRLVVGFCLLLFVLRTIVLADSWYEWDSKVREFRTGVAGIERGARVMTVGEPPVQYYHLNAMAAIDRSAFIPTIFTGATILRAGPTTRHIDTPSGVPLSEDNFRLPDPDDGYHSRYWDDWQNEFDYVITLDPVDDSLGPWGTLIFSGSFFRVYEVSVPTPAATSSSTPAFDVPSLFDSGTGTGQPFRGE